MVEESKMSLIYMNARCKAILNILLNADSYTTLSQIEKSMKVSSKEFMDR